MAHNEKPVWLITGCSTGFGRDLATHLLEGGYPTVVTARNPEAVKDLAAKGDALLLKLDVTDPAQIDAAIKAAEEKFGRIDVLVNNAGIGYLAAVEESEDDQLHRMFDINVFGLGRMMIGIVTQTTPYPLDQANRALADLRAGRFEGAAVLVP